MATLGQRLRQARRGRRLTQQNVADAVGVTSAAVSQWELDQTQPSQHALGILSGLTGVSLNWLYFGEERAAIDHSAYETATVGRVVPSIEWTNIEQFVAGNVDIASGSVRSHFPCGQNSFQTFVHDRSNEPDLSVGDSIIVDPDRRPAPGEYCLAFVSGEYVIRRIRVREKSIELVPKNDDWDVAEVGAGADAIVGAVTEYSRRLG